MPTIGIIGGSGLLNPDAFAEACGRQIEKTEDLALETPYWRARPRPSGACVWPARTSASSPGTAGSIRCPTTWVNNRANIHALKELGCQCILATTACGSLRLEIGRGDLVILDQFIDFTRHRPITFHEQFEPHAPFHVPMAEPFSRELRRRLIDGCRALDLAHHERGTMVTIEGPRFSTRAESHMFRLWGADVINMSTGPECILANEAGLPYAAVAMSTDYDCWKEDEEPVTWQEVLRIFNENAQKVTRLLVHILERIE